MNEPVHFTTFVVGPEPDGRGSGILSHSEHLGGTGWQGGLPLVLLEWAKLRAAEGFSGRFSVTGGAIAIKAAYFGEGSAGPIARAFGVFIEDALLPLVQGSERSLFAAVPVPSSSDDFGTQSLDVRLVPDRPARGGNGLGLAWHDRQIFVAAPQSLEDVALDVLASIEPAGQKMRVTGWCTTSQLAARGDFLPIQRCNLLVTRPGEPLAHDRFLPAQWDMGAVIDDAKIRPPASYLFWMQLVQMVGDQPGSLHDAMGWFAEMSDWTDEELAWRFIEILSQHQAEYQVIVGVILSLGDLQGEGRQAVSAATMRNYLLAVANHDRAKLPELIDMFHRFGGGRRPMIAAALDETMLALLNEPLLALMDDATLLRLIRLLREQTETGAVENVQIRLEMLDDQSVWRALGREIRSPGVGEGERRIHLTAIRAQLGRSAEATNIDYHKLFLRRKIVGHMLNDRGSSPT